MSAPGVDVVSSVPGDGYDAFSGTSMAAPHTAGTLALVLSAELALLGDVDGSTDAVRSTALDIADDSCGGDEDGDPNNVYGDGRIDAQAAVSLVATGGTLAGDVTDVVSSDPIAGARIEATTGGRTFATTADADGHFELFLGAGTYTVTASAFAYQSALVTGVEIETDLTTTQDFFLAPLPQRQITGTVTAEEDGSPIEGAEVRAIGTPVPAAITDGNGDYVLTLPIGDHTIRVSAGGCTDSETTEVTLGLAGLVLDASLARTLDDFGHGCRPIAFDWVDAASTTAMFGDQTIGRLALPFSFPFYGESYDTVYITDNGYLTFEAPEFGFPDPVPSPIPSEGTPNTAIYALWQNLVIDDDSAVRFETVGDSPDRAFVVEYEQMKVGPQFGDLGEDADHRGDGASGRRGQALGERNDRRALRRQPREPRRWKGRRDRDRERRRDRRAAVLLLGGSPRRERRLSVRVRADGHRVRHRDRRQRRSADRRRRRHGRPGRSERHDR